MPTKPSQFRIDLFIIWNLRAREREREWVRDSVSHRGNHPNAQNTHQCTIMLFISFSSICSHSFFSIAWLMRYECSVGACLSISFWMNDEKNKKAKKNCFLLPIPAFVFAPFARATSNSKSFIKWRLNTGPDNLVLSVRWIANTDDDDNATIASKQQVNRNTRSRKSEQRAHHLLFILLHIICIYESVFFFFFYFVHWKRYGLKH